MSLEGKIQVQADLVPTNDNPKQWVTTNKYVKGAPQVFNDIAALVAFHPKLMVLGMPAKVMGYPAFNSSTEFTLIVDPNSILDANNDSIVTVEDFLQYWEITNQKDVNVNKVVQYSKGLAGGARPTYPYTLGGESQWEAEGDQSKGYAWTRFRTDDIDTNVDGIYDNWSIPIPSGSLFLTGDYIENRFIRQAVSETIHVASGTLILDKVYIILNDTITVTGDTELEKQIGVDINGDVILTPSRKFTFKAGVTYVFNNGATARESLLAPVAAIGGLPNNLPVGWTDVVPGGTDQLWKITAQKSVYQQLKSAWVIQRVNESPDLIRFNDVANPHPDTIVDTSTAATTGSGGDTALIAEGWVSAYVDQDFMATREDLGGGTYSVWAVEKINQESGEYDDRVFKLFDVTLDNDDPILVAPTGNNPSDQGWTDGLQLEVDLLVNYVSVAVRYFDGTLKSAWTHPVPYTAKPTFSDIIRSDSGDNFKKDKLDVITPTEIRLTAELYKGHIKQWEVAGASIAYTWLKVYDDGAIVSVSPSDNPADDFYQLAAAGSYLDDQIVGIKPDGVTGKAVFRCTQVLTTPSQTLSFVTEYSVLDISDGKDARNLSVTATKQLVIYDTVNLVFNPLTVDLRAYQSNLPLGYAFKWFVGSVGAWTEITGAEAEYDLPTPNRLVITNTSLFAGDTTAESFQFAVTTHGSNPDSADYDTSFSDFISIEKSSSAAVGVDGEASLIALLDNESHTVVLDTSNNETPFAGEVGLGAKATTKLQVYEGLNPLVYGGGNDYTIAVSPNSGTTFFDFVANGDDVDIYVDTWLAGNVSEVCTITITYGTKTLTKKFSISTTKDAPGAVVLDLDSTNGYAFTPNERTTKTITANLYDTAVSDFIPQAAGYEYRFTSDNGTLGNLRDWSATRTIDIARSSVDTQMIIRCDVRPTAGAILRSRTVIIYDVVDGQRFILYADDVSAPTKPADTVTPSGNATWTTNATGAIWAVDGNERWPIATPTDVGKYDWSDVRKLVGEDGSQGNQGNFVFPMYLKSTLASTTVLSNGSAAYLFSLGWRAGVPSRSVAELQTHNIFVISRPYVGESVTFDGNGLPSTGGVAGTTWQQPTILSPKNPLAVNGIDGLKTESIYRKNTSETVPPTTPTGNNPVSWSTAPPTRVVGEHIWGSEGVKNSAGVLQGVWSTPVLWSGFDGEVGPQGAAVGLTNYWHNVKINLLNAWGSDNLATVSGVTHTVEVIVAAGGSGVNPGSFIYNISAFAHLYATNLGSAQWQYKVEGYRYLNSPRVLINQTIVAAVQTAFPMAIKVHTIGENFWKFVFTLQMTSGTAVLELDQFGMEVKRVPVSTPV